MSEGIVLHGWSKTYDNTAHSEGSLFLKPEWIIHVINIIRAVPKEVLNRGEGPKEKLAKHFEKTLIDDEFNAFVDLKNTVPKVMLKAIDSTQSIKEQKDAMFQATHTVENNNPAYDNFYGSRSHILSDLIYASVLKTAGLPYDHKTNEWVKTI